MSVLKRISMAGADVAVTSGQVADLVLEYAKHLGRVSTTDIVAVPVVRHGQVRQAALLLGPASQIAVVEDDETDVGALVLPGLPELIDDLRRRIAGVAGLAEERVIYEEMEPNPTFTDFDTYL